MTQDISGFGLQINIKADTTFPSGIVLTQFADDADPLDSADITIAEKAMGLNGDMIVWSTASPFDMITNLIPGSDDAKNMALLFEANRIGRGKTSAQDKITAVVTYPDGETETLTDGRIISGPVIDRVASAGRKKTAAYGFAFENKN